MVMSQMKNYDPGRGSRWTWKKQRSSLPAAVPGRGEMGVGSEALSFSSHSTDPMGRTISAQSVAKAAGCGCLHLTASPPPQLFFCQREKKSAPWLYSTSYLKQSWDFQDSNPCPEREAPHHCSEPCKESSQWSRAARGVSLFPHIFKLKFLNRCHSLLKEVETDTQW